MSQNTTFHKDEQEQGGNLCCFFLPLKISKIGSIKVK